ncbi:hypothetical protein [Agromyces bauzanensis]
MSQDFTEILIAVATTVEAGLLLFIAEVVQRVMDEMDAAQFRRFLGRLEHFAMRSPTVLAGSLVTTVACIPYFIFFGFDNWWFTAGIIVWFLAAVASKIFNAPIYKRVAGLHDTDVAELLEQRRMLRTANVVRALTTLASVVLMIIGLA